MHGGQIMYHQIQEAMSRVTIPPSSSDHRWARVFSRFEYSCLLRGIQRIRPTSFLRWMKQINCLNQGEMATRYPYTIEHKIRVIEYADRKWYIDPLIRAHWNLWVLAKKPVFKLDWDPVDYQLGRHVLSDTRDMLPTAFQYWNQ